MCLRAFACIALVLAACGGDSSTASTDGTGAGSTSGAPATSGGTAQAATEPGSSGDPATSEPTGGEITGGAASTTSTATATAGPGDTGEATDAGETAAGSTTNELPPPPVCPDPPTCASVELTATEHHLSLLDGCAFAVAPTDFAAGVARADELLARTGTAVGISAVLGQLNREAVPGLSAYQADRMKNHDYTGFRWNDGDGAVDYWYPQGISGGSDARGDGEVEGRRVLLVSWYHNIEREPDDPPARGVRLSLVDISDLQAIRYRHLLLVTPTGNGDTVNFGAANYGDGDPLHAGGIVWIGDRLYVVETGSGFRVYDMSRIFEVANTDDDAAIGISGGEVNAHGYRYAVPEIGRYKLTAESCALRFSAVGLDRDADPPALVTVEYQTDLTGRVARWPIDVGSTELVTHAGVVHAIGAALAGQTRMQGAVTHDGVFYLSSSSQIDQWGRLYRNVADGTSEITAWPDGPEDLYVERDRELIWTTAEHPNKRVTLGIPMQGY